MKCSRIFLFLTATLMSATLWARGGGGDFVNNGGGIAEKNVFYAYEKIDKYIQTCLKSDACKLNEQQKVILQQIANGLPQEKQVQQQLVFASEKKNPGTFMIDGLVRVAKTGSAVGSPIYINVDLLYTKTETGDYAPMSIAEAVAVLVHEFGHHYGNYTHEELDLIGVRVSLLLQQKVVNTPMIPWNSSVSASVFNADMLQSFPQVLLTVGNDVIDLSSIYQREVHCEVLTLPIPIGPLPDIELITKTPKGSVFHNIHWEKMKERGDYYDVKITGNVSNTCEYKNQSGLRNNNFQLSISFRINKVNGLLIYDPSTLEMNQFKNPWWKLIRFP
jgi:hypothetical protein